MKKYRALVLFPLLFLAAGCTTAGRYPLVNPSLKNLARTPLPPAKLKVEELVRRQIGSGAAGHISVYFQSLATGYWFGINEQEKFIPASLLKGYLLVMFLKAAETDPGLLHKQVELKDYSWLFANNTAPLPQIKPDQELVFGRSYTVEHLLSHMIAESDNNAAYNLQMNFLPGGLARVLHDYGIEMPDKEVPFVTVKNYMMLLLSLYNASYLSIGMSQKALAYLADSHFRSGLVAGVPPGVKIAHKFGERLLSTSDGQLMQLHDCGVVYHKKTPYLLGIMTRGSDLKALEKVITDISALVYAEVDASAK
ncbi:MAG: serine hydrolase [Elusimicrobiota bacterium]